MGLRMSSSAMKAKTQKAFAVGQIADLCLVARKTAQEWIDEGWLRGHSLPGSNERRVHRDDLVAFLKKFGNTRAIEALGEPTSETKTVLVVATEAHWFKAVEALFSDQADVSPIYAPLVIDVGWQCAKHVPAVVVVDFAVGRADAMMVGNWLKRQWPEMSVAGLVPEDCGGRGMDVMKKYGYDELFGKPVGAQRIAEWVKVQLKKEPHATSSTS